MLYGVGLGPGDRELLTLKAVRVIKEADEVIVPGKLAYSIVSEFREPRLVEFPMGKSEEVTKKLAAELAERCVDENIAFASLGDPAFYSTFQHVAEEVVRINPSIEVEIIPGIASFTAVFAKMKKFVDAPLIVTTAKMPEVKHVVVLKASKPADIHKKLSQQGFSKILLATRIFMEGEKIEELDDAIPEKSDYFTLIVGSKE
ncbi:SAM-dependent methyltransferase [Archaeoglobus veneficus]|uniref:Uroporphyrin-III C/tetrapyrrole (Corrin/Porphyrin) methyltransferase n=1 Tax=Archaeoglobus veneficus (strain DSM 11195 / SNP6) TaxID=693661 RepID=F2KS03_ARCVS|nr:SAM-dependent methyltransferase [Archaeoglobus veneficus]AEA46844.1 Uroporphyrin-III C/tetrapyrrole (Corrin/Porphyrin) methyltransferase [Archaeoglobus veneficus SNP6]